MKFIKVAPLVGVLVYVSMLMLPRQVSASPKTDKVSQHDASVPELPVFTDVVVGDFNYLTGPDTFLPNQRCKVNTGQDILKILQDCKNQRKGWLKI
tara:strand:+ start:809 stop:1096 length:288 start_codon:yes stop_codon:yes gene_type:complete